MRGNHRRDCGYLASKDLACDCGFIQPEPRTLARIKARWSPDEGAVLSDLDAAYEAGKRDGEGLPPLMRVGNGGAVERADMAFSVMEENCNRAIKQRDDALAAVAKARILESLRRDGNGAAEDIAKEFGLPLGVPITEGVAALVRTQAAEIARMRKFSDETDDHVNALQQEIIGQSNEISRLRNPAPEPAPRAVARPLISALWDDVPGMLPSGMVRL